MHACTVHIIYACVCVCMDSDDVSEVDMSSPLNYGTPSSSRLGDTPRTPGALGTPHRSRADIRTERRPTVAVGASSELVILAGLQALPHFIVSAITVMYPAVTRESRLYCRCLKASQCKL